MRTTFYDVRQSRIPQVLGVAAADVPTLLSYVNEAQRRLIKSSGDKGWWGSWAKMVFNVDPANPMLTAPRTVARITDMSICRTPIRIQNEYFEFLEYGCGLQRPLPNCQSACASESCATMQALDRGMFPTTVDITAGQKLRVFLTESADVGKKIFFSGTDINDDAFTEIVNGVQVNGFYITLASPFVDSTAALNTLTGIMKEITYGPVRIYGLDTTTGDVTLLATLAPGDTSPTYRRYFLTGLPTQCTDCDSATGVVQVTGMAKIEYNPVANDSDFMTIGNLDALKAECQAIRLEEMDNMNAATLAKSKHKDATRLLNEEIIHYLGKETPALSCKPWGRDTLERRNLQMM